MKIKSILWMLVFGFSILIVQAQHKTRVFYVELKNGQIISDNPVKEYPQKPAHESGKKIVLYPEIKLQTLEGIGGAFNEIGGEALMSLPDEQRNKVMKNLFNEADGAGFSFCRTAIGASDFGINAYSYSEVKDDYQMVHFSLQREENAVLPYIQLAYKYNPHLKMFASPWSPPGWMKYSGVMDRGVEFQDKNHLIDEPKIYQAYAAYFTKYVQAYAENGITISRLVIQNENDMHTKYPSCVMPVQQMSHFAQKYLRPAFLKNKVKTEIWAGTFRTADQADALEMASDTKLCKAFDGFGIQYTRTQYIQDMTQLFPGVKMMHTEGNCFNGDNSQEQARKRLDEVASYLNSGCPNYCYWNMILNETGKSGWDWKQNTLINIDRQNKTVTYNPDYAVFALISKFIQPGAKRIASFSRSLLISVENDGKIALLVQNDTDKADTYEYWIKENKTVVEIPANSVAAIVLTQK